MRLAGWLGLLLPARRGWHGMTALAVAGAVAGMWRCGGKQGTASQPAKADRSTAERTTAVNLP
jgi:hypothetical protein